VIQKQKEEEKGDLVRAENGSGDAQVLCQEVGGAAAMAAETPPSKQ